MFVSGRAENVKCRSNDKNVPLVAFVCVKIVSKWHALKFNDTRFLFLFVSLLNLQILRGADIDFLFGLII